MGLNEGDRVHIKDTDITGLIIDVSITTGGTVWYMIESDKEGFTDDPKAVVKGPWPAYHATADQLEIIK